MTINDKTIRDKANNVIADFSSKLWRGPKARTGLLPAEKHADLFLAAARKAHDEGLLR